jgi:VIT1/CCC1 family predicted Fe2+/Mn2+ transporter
MSELSSWVEEKQAAYLYHVVAEVEAGTPRASLFIELAGEAEKQAAIWATLAVKAGHLAPTQYAPNMRTRVVAALLRRFGARPLRTVLSAMKVRGMSLYTHSMHGHTSHDPGGEMGKRHRGMGSGSNLRAAVFGVNDGLISNASLIMGMAGATSAMAGNQLILLSGVAGLIAGAFSMAAGEYVSVRSQREMFEYQIGLEQEELDHYPEEEAEELALIYQARGLPRDDAVRLATQLSADPARALDTLAREELGLNPDDLGSPWGAALFSFSAFALGAVVPLLPFLFVSGARSLIVAIALTAAALFAVGATLSLFTGRNAWWSGVRMLGIGCAAGAVTYVIGKMLGVSLA